MKHALKHIRKLRERKTMRQNIIETLHGIIFPGEGYKHENTGLLAKNLRQLADEIEAGEDAQLLPFKQKKKQRDFDFSKYQQRYVALELMYLGHDFYGFAKQDSAKETIEEHLFAALRKTRLIKPDMTWKELQYSRGGRTDRGVSALGQVVALLLRSVSKVGEPLTSEDQEMDYPAILNRVLPSTIRVLGWTTAPKEFSARFSAEFREYKYFIIDDTRSSLDIERMKRAASSFVGEHDFRNFCKADVAKVKNFRRRIMKIELNVLPTPMTKNESLVELYICGTAFLWHQVRYMSEVLLMIGKGLEDPSVVESMLDVSQTSAKPQFAPASEEPLLLFSCSYQGLQFRRSSRVYADIMAVLDRMKSSHIVRSAIIESIEKRMDNDAVLESYALAKHLREGPKHIPLSKRPREPSVDERLQKFDAKRNQM